MFICIYCKPQNYKSVCEYTALQTFIHYNPTLRETIQTADHKILQQQHLRNIQYFKNQIAMHRNGRNNCQSKY